MRKTFPLVLGLILLANISAAAETTENYFQVTEIAPDLLLLSTDQGSYSNNSLVFTGENGILLVDTHHGADAEAFKEFIDDLGFGPPKYIVTTHRHQEHIGGNHLWGESPIIIGHHLLADRMSSGTYLFNGYPPEAFPEISFTETMELIFNGEVVRLADIGGSHDDNEIMVHFTQHGVAHISSVVNGFNFPSVDTDGSALGFEEMTRHLMQLLPPETRLVSGHHGADQGFAQLGTWQMLEPYADMMRDSQQLVRQQLDAGKTQEQMQQAGLLDRYDHFAGSYVDADGWIEYLVDALTVPRETRLDICKPIYETWQMDGAQAAVLKYEELLAENEDKYDFHDYVLQSIGAKLYTRGLHTDAVDFLAGHLRIYPDSEYSYYTQYLLALTFNKLEKKDLAVDHCRQAMVLNEDFVQAKDLLNKLLEE